jgi:hypothetical protein
VVLVDEAAKDIQPFDRRVGIQTVGPLACHRHREVQTETSVRAGGVVMRLWGSKFRFRR